MKEKDWLVDNNGVYLPLKILSKASKKASMYRLYYFLTDFAHILATTADNVKIRGAIASNIIKL